MSFWYVATPYAKYPHGLDAAYRLACKVTADLAKAGVPVFSPIAHGQGLADHGGVAPTDHDVWMTINRPMMEAATRGIIMVLADGWEISRGMAAEAEEFSTWGRRIIEMVPGEIPAGLTP